MRPPPDKRSVRTAQLARLRAVDEETVVRESHAACRALRQHTFWPTWGIIAAYLPMPAARGAEADPWPALGGRKVALPRVDWETGDFDVRLVPGGDWRSSLEDDRYGLGRPPSSWRVVKPAKLALVLVPGVAFDAGCRRLGRGAGMYDRFLGSLDPTMPMVGMAIEAQVVERVPTEGHDVRLTAVATPHGVMLPR